MAGIGILIVDDHPMIREGLMAMLAAHKDIIILGTASDGQEAVQAVETLAPDVVLMDIKMKKVNGLEATREIKAGYPAVKVIILTIYEDAESIRLAMQMGASGYLLKQATGDRLAEGIRLAHRGETVIDSTLLGRLIVDYTRLAQGSAAAHGTAAADENRELTPRENEVAKFLSQGLTNKEISSKTHLAVDTVKTHLRSIYRKMGVKNRSQAITEIMSQRQGSFRV